MIKRGVRWQFTYALLLSLALGGLCHGAANNINVVIPHQKDASQQKEFQNIYSILRNLQTSVPSGTIFSFAGSTTTIPTGFLVCDGSAVSRTTYSFLFSALGTAWGIGDGSTTFNLPDFRRRVLVGSGGSGTATLGNSLGNTGGEETHTQTVNEMPSHGHAIADPGHSHSERARIGAAGGANIAVRADGSGDTIQDNTYQTTLSATTGISLSNTGGGTAFNVIQPSAVINFIIKT